MKTLKTHVSLNVKNLEESISFYKAFFGVDPVRVRPKYAKFDIQDPPLNFSLIQRNQSVMKESRLSHLGIQVDDSKKVEAAVRRFKQAGMETEVENDTHCCYALQDKVWVSDPSGNRWEVFVVKKSPEDAG